MSEKAKDYGEPWTHDEGYGDIEDRNGNVVIAGPSSDWEDCNLSRASLCVNAMAGVSDEALQTEALRKLVFAINAFLKQEDRQYSDDDDADDRRACAGHPAIRVPGPIPGPALSLQGGAASPTMPWEEMSRPYEMVRPLRGRSARLR